jgi:WD40 repeat protein
MDPITTSIGFVIGLIGFLASTVQILDYLDKRREKQQTIERVEKQKVIQTLDVTSIPNLKSKPQTALNTIQNRIDWGEATDVSVFYGRIEEIAKLKNWVVQERCRLVALLGIGGIGKTSLSIKLTQEIQDNFEYIIWRTLRNAPPIKEILADFIKFLSNQQQTDLPEEVGARISLLIDYLTTSRCLLVLDNAESILQPGQSGVQRIAYRDGYEDYGELFRRIGGTSHQSCLIITSREKPQEVAASEGETFPVRSLQLTGLKPKEGEEIFDGKGLSGTEAEKERLIQFYQGSPLALNIISTTVKELFDGSISDFLSQGSVVFGGIREVLEQQCDRLSDLEKQVMYWLAINREPVSLTELREDILPPASQSNFIEAFESLIRRSLIEKSAALFTLQPVVMEYLTDTLIEQVCEEIQTGKIEVFNKYALIKTTAKDYIRESQIRLILQVVIDKLLANLRSKKNLENQLKQIISSLQEKSLPQAGYAGGNILNILRYLETDFTEYDFSNLVISQAYLQGINLQRVNLADSEITKSVFTQTFGSIHSVAFSPDGKLLVAGDTDGQIRVWQVADGKEILSFQAHTSWIYSVVFSPDGITFASASRDKTISLWNVITGECLKTLQGETSSVRSIAFSPDGQIIASATFEKYIGLWDINTGECLIKLHYKDHWVRKVVFSPDGQTLASGGSDETVCLWDVKTGECLKIFQGHTQSVRAVIFSPDGKIIVSASGDRTIRLWDVANGQCLGIIQGHTDAIESLALSGDGQIASASQDKTIKLWDINTKECLKTLKGHTYPVESIAFSPNGNILASGSHDQTVRLWDVQDGKSLKIFQGYSSWVVSLAFSPNVGTQDFLPILASANNHSVSLWDFTTGECVNNFQGHSSYLWSVCFHPQGNIIASGSQDSTVRLWDVKTGICLKILRGHSYIVRSVCFSPDGEILASCGSDNTIKLWNVSEGKCLHTLNKHTKTIRSIAFSPDGKIIASGSYDRTIILWDANTGEQIKVLRGSRNEVYTVAFSPNGNILASGNVDQTIQLWDMNTREHIQTLAGHSLVVQSIAFSPDGQTLVSGSADKTIKLWNVNTGECLRTLLGHTTVIRSVAITPDGTYIASGSQDETIRFWDFNTGECQKILRVPRPYEGMNTTGVTGLTEAQKATLKALGAVEL